MSLDLINLSGRKKLTLIHQTELAECGLACLAMVSGYYGHQWDLVTLRKKFTIPLTGANLKSLMYIGDQMNLICRPVKLDLDQMMGLKTPAILHWNMNHFVVLSKVTPNKITIYDPARGVMEYTPEQATSHFTGVAVELSPAENFTQKNETVKMRVSDFWSHISGLKKALITTFIASFVLQLFMLASPLYMQIVVDEALLNHDRSLLTVLAIGFFCLLVFQNIAQAFRGYLVLSIGHLLNYQMANNLMRHLLRLPMQYFESRHIGDTVTRFESLDSIGKLLTEGVIETIIDGVLSLTMIVVLFIYSPKLTFIVLGFLAVYLIVRLIYYKPIKRATEDSIVAKASEQSNFMETVRGIQIVKLYCSEPERQALWLNRMATTINNGIRLGKIAISYQTLGAMIFAVETILVVYVAANEVLDNVISVGMLFAFIAYKDRFLNSAKGLIEKLIEFMMLSLHMTRLADIAKTEAEPDYDETPNLTASPKNGIELKNVYYRYSQGEEYVLKNISLTIEKGQSIAITGKSGSGKTTLLKLMIGLFSPTKGSILIDGVPLNAFGLRNYRKKVATVMQNDKLFSGSIADNISNFDSTPDDKLIEQCAKLACIHEDICHMPMEYNTLVGDMGAALSGGQAQRVLLARALYKKPEILFLDEATSHLDSETESEINSNLKSMKIIRISVAHRQSTIENAEHIYDVFKGKINYRN